MGVATPQDRYFPSPHLYKGTPWLLLVLPAQLRAAVALRDTFPKPEAVLGSDSFAQGQPRSCVNSQEWPTRNPGHGTELELAPLATVPTTLSHWQHPGKLCLLAQDEKTALKKAVKKTALSQGQGGKMGQVTQNATPTHTPRAAQKFL